MASDLREWILKRKKWNKWEKICIWGGCKNFMNELGFKRMNGFIDGYEREVGVKNEHIRLNTWDE